MGYLLILANNGLECIGTICRKGILRRSFHVRSALDIYIILAHPIAAMYFFLLSGGNVPLNGPSAVFALVYATICLISVTVSMIAMDRASLVYTSIFSGAGGVVFPFLFDMLILGRPFVLTRFLSVVVRLCAIAAPLLTTKTERKNLRICVLLFFIAGASPILAKLYSSNPDVVSDSSYYFWTNIFVLPISVVSVMIKSKWNWRGVVSDISKIDGKGYLCIFLATACSNIGSLLTLSILRLVDVSVNAVVSGSVGMLITVFLSTVVYKERFTVRSAISVTCSITALVLGVL